MKHRPCSMCGYVIRHDEECPGCAREEMDLQLAALQGKLDSLRDAALRYMSNLASQEGKDALKAAIAAASKET